MSVIFPYNIHYKNEYVVILKANIYMLIFIGILKISRIAIVNYIYIYICLCVCVVG